MPSLVTMALGVVVLDDMSGIKSRIFYFFQLVVEVHMTVLPEVRLSVNLSDECTSWMFGLKRPCCTSAR
jgi:hypothetical protein